MKKLWQKDYTLDKDIEKFTVGNDTVLDVKLVEFDCVASIAHVRMLSKQKLLTSVEEKKLVEGLHEIIKLNEQGKFQIPVEDEDCHTAIENFLTEKYGALGKKIHTARSRNDQVLVALRLYEKEECLKIQRLGSELHATLKDVAKKNVSIIMPGYTHTRKAMPAPVSMWLGSYAASLEDDLELVKAVAKLIDQSPLGSGAGFGIPILPIDRKFTADELHFSSVMENPMYAQISRGKLEASVIHALSGIMLTLNRLASDLILFSMPKFGYIDLPPEICTGSSIMPQKYNPDALELIRASYHILCGEEVKIKGIIGNLIEGYHRDLQLTKEPVIKSFEITQQSLKVMQIALQKLKFNADACKKDLTDELFATEKAYNLVAKGMPFREAYDQIAKEYKH